MRPLHHFSGPMTLPTLPSWIEFGATFYTVDPVSRAVEQNTVWGVSVYVTPEDTTVIVKGGRYDWFLEAIHPTRAAAEAAAATLPPYPPLPAPV